MVGPQDIDVLCVQPNKSVQNHVEPIFLVGLLEIWVLQHFEQFPLVVHIKHQCPVGTMTEFRHANKGQMGEEVGGESCVKVVINIK